MTLDLLLLPFLDGMTMGRKSQVPHPSKIWLCDAWRWLLWVKCFEEGRNKASALVCLKSNPQDFTLSPCWGCLCAGSITGCSSLLLPFLCFPSSCPARNGPQQLDGLGFTLSCQIQNRKSASSCSQQVTGQHDLCL